MDAVVQILAHRGATAVARENTIAAFAGAGTVGADGVELDVRATADGIVVVVHDAVIEGLGPVAELAADELPAWLPTLDQALDACDSLALVNVEIKADWAAPRLAETVATLLGARKGGPALLVSSFDLALLDAHRSAAPSIATGWLTLPGLAEPALAAALETAAARGHGALHLHESTVTGGLVTAARQAELLAVAWTVNNPERAVELAQLGVGVLITDDPAGLRAALSGLSER